MLKIELLLGKMMGLVWISCGYDWEDHYYPWAIKHVWLGNRRTKWRFLAVKSIELGIFEQAMFDYQGFPFQKHRIIPIRAAYLHSSPFVANKHQQQILTILRASVHPVY